LAEVDTVMKHMVFDTVLLDAEVRGPVEHTISFLQRVKKHGFPGRVIAISGQPQNNTVLRQYGADAGFVKTDFHRIMSCVFSPV